MTFDQSLLRKILLSVTTGITNPSGDGFITDSHHFIQPAVSVTSGIMYIPTHIFVTFPSDQSSTFITTVRSEYWRKSKYLQEVGTCLEKE